MPAYPCTLPSLHDRLIFGRSTTRDMYALEALGYRMAKTSLRYQNRTLKPVPCITSFWLRSPYMPKLLAVSLASIVTKAKVDGKPTTRIGSTHLCKLHPFHAAPNMRHDQACPILTFEVMLVPCEDETYYRSLPYMDQPIMRISK
eukprot:scaffold360285_cov45-Prasinocladus_malaysianus.AAC.2